MSDLRDARYGEPAGWSLAHKARKSKGLTGKALAAECGCSFSHMYRVLAGLRTPSDDLLKMMATVLEVDKQELIDDFPWHIYDQHGDLRPRDGARPDETEAA